MPMEPRLTLVTLGVADVPRARDFYRALGFTPSGFASDDVCFFDAGGVVLGLFGRQPLADEAHVAAEGSGFRAFTLAHNARSEADVDAVLAHAVSCGARQVKAAEKVFWGGYSGYFADLDGHLWEVAYNPGFPLDERGHLMLPPPQALP
jgi:hypothetical protein